MRIRWNSIVTVAVILAALVLVQVIVAVQAPAGQQGGPAAGARGGAPAGGAAAPGQGAGRGGGARGGGGRGGQQAAAPAGPTPRLPNGKPDLSGHWTNPYTANMARGGVLDPTKKRADGTCCEPLTWERQGEALADAKGGAKTFDLPYTEWGRKKWADYDVVANGDYAGSCLPFGWSRNINSPHGVQILQNNDAIAFLFEQNTWHTWVPTKADFKWPADLPRTWNGTSVGKWDGDTLVIETKGFNGYTKLDTTGHPHSKDVTFITTLLRTDSNTIQHTVTIHDPKAYTKDWMNVRTWRLKGANDVLMEYSCEENNLGIDDGSIVRWKFPESVD